MIVFTMGTTIEIRIIELEKETLHLLLLLASQTNFFPPLSTRGGAVLGPLMGSVVPVQSRRSTLPMQCMAMIDKEMDQEEERLSKAAFYLAKIRATLEEYPSLDFDKVHDHELWRLLVENDESKKGELMGRRRDEEQDKSTCSQYPEPCHVIDQATRVKEQIGGETIYTSLEAEPHRAIGLRPIVIDGPNVAFCHGKDKVFSAKGIKLVIEYFKMRGHQKIVAYVPELWRKSEETLDPQVLEQLYDQDVVVFTPSVSYVDMYILDYAAAFGGVVISRDRYRDLLQRKEVWKEVIKKRVLVPTFPSQNVVQMPNDPMGKRGPTLDQFLTFSIGYDNNNANP